MLMCHIYENYVSTFSSCRLNISSEKLNHLSNLIIAFMTYLTQPQPFYRNKSHVKHFSVFCVSSNYSCKKIPVQMKMFGIKKFTETEVLKIIWPVKISPHKQQCNVFKTICVYPILRLQFLIIYFIHQYILKLSLPRATLSK